MYSLIIKSPNYTVADFPLSCSPTWTVADLKVHLASQYPGEPPVSSQRLIYSGKLLSDSQCISTALCKPNNTEMNETFALHLVITPSKDKITTGNGQTSIKVTDTNSSNNSNVRPEESSSNQPSTSAAQTDSFQQYQQEYEEYLRGYYYHCLWQQMYAQGPFHSPFTWNNEQLGGGTELNQLRNRFVIAGNVEEPPAAADGARGALGQGIQGPQIVEEPRGAPPNNVAPPLGGFLEAADVGNGEAGENRDPMDMLYGLLRLALLGALVYYYSTPEKAVLSLLLLGLIYILQGNFYRRYVAYLLTWFQNHNADRDPTPAAPPAPATQAAPLEESSEGTNVEPNQQVNSEMVERFVVLRTIISVLASSGRIFISFFTSLIPERPPVIDVN